MIEYNNNFIYILEDTYSKYNQNSIQILSETVLVIHVSLIPFMYTL